MADVVGAFASNAFFGQQTLAESLRTAGADFEKGDLQINRPVALYKYLEKKVTGAEPTPKLSFEQWQQSEYYRQGIDYDPNMTVGLAKILAKEKDMELTFGFTAGRASGLEAAIGFGSGFLIGVLEPRNLAAGAAATVALGGLHGTAAKLGHRSVQMGKAAKRMEKTFGKAGSVKRAVSEGFIGAAILEPGNFDNATTLQKDYGMADSMFNLGLSVAASGGIQYGLNAVSKARGRKVTRQEGIDASLYAISQVKDGKRIDTKLVHDLYDSISGDEKPPSLSEIETMQRISNEIPDESGVHDYFFQEARRLKETYKSSYDVDISSPRAVEKALDLPKFEAMTIKEKVKQLGGLVIDGDYKSRDIGYTTFPGLFRKTAKELADEGKDPSKGGKSFDVIISDLKQAGFFPDKDIDAITKNDLIDALEQDISGQRVYPEHIQEKIDANLSPVTSLTESMDAAGVDISSSIDDLASQLQQSYVDNGLLFGQVDAPPAPERVTMTQQEVLEEYGRNYEEWKEIDLYDSSDPDEYLSEAKAIKSDMNDVAYIDKDILELEQEFLEMESSGLLSDADKDELSYYNEISDVSEESAEVIRAGTFCLTRG